jgi:hypothetical protein
MVDVAVPLVVTKHGKLSQKKEFLAELIVVVQFLFFSLYCY